MSVLDLRATDDPSVPCAAPQTGVRAGSGRTFELRLAAAAGLTAVASSAGYADAVAAALTGSRTAILLVTPVLLVLVTTGYRTPPRGVGDGESDWIIAALIGIGGFTAIHLLTDRLPTLAALWRLPGLGVVVSFACALTVLFGVRHVVRMPALWLFALFISTPLPFVLSTAAFGGTDRAAMEVAASFGALAVALATRSEPPRERIAAALGCLAAGLALAWTMGPVTASPVGTLVAAGVLPVLTH